MRKYISLTKEENGEYKVPKEVWISNWRDDIQEEKEAEEDAIKFETFKDESNYKSPKEVSKETQERMLRWAKAQKIGHLALFH